MTHNTISVLNKVNSNVDCFCKIDALIFTAMKMTYGDRLKSARKYKGLSQDQLAKKSHVGQGTISQIERGDQHASIYDIELAMALDVQPIWLKSGLDQYAPEWLHNPEAKPPEPTPRTRLETILDAAEDAMRDSGLEFTDDEKLELYIEAVEFAGAKRFSPKLIANYLMDISINKLKKKKDPL